MFDLRAESDLGRAVDVVAFGKHPVYGNFNEEMLSALTGMIRPRKERVRVELS